MKLTQALKLQEERVHSLSPSKPQSGSAGVVEHPLATALETGSGWSAHHDRQGSTYLVFRTRHSNVTVWRFGSR